MENFDISESTGTKKEFILYFLINLAIGVLLYYVLDNSKQTIAGTIFIALVIGTLVFWKFRVAIAFLGIALLLVTGTIDLPHTVEYMSLDVILFLVGMMIIVALLRRSGFFKWVLSFALEITGFKPGLLFLMVLVMSAIMAALVDEVTSILFTTALIMDFCEFFEIKPIKLIIAVVLATNVGSSWTVLGNPIGILIALRSGLTFEDFLGVAFPVGLVSLVSIIAITALWMRSDLPNIKTLLHKHTGKERREFLDKEEHIPDRKMFFGAALIFFTVIPLLANHHRLEVLLKLEPNTMLVGISLLGAGVAMLWQRAMAREVLMKDVDWWTLVFFMFLFAKAGALEFVGLTEVVGKAMLDMAGGGDNMYLLIIVVLWVTAFASAAADNVVVVATFVPVLQYLSQTTHTEILWWALLFGGCYGGNMTMVGSTANIIALGMLEERAKFRMTLTYWFKIGFWGALFPMVIGTAALLGMQYFEIGITPK